MEKIIAYCRFENRKTTQFYMDVLETIRLEQGEKRAKAFAQAVRERGDEIITGDDMRATYWLTESDVRGVAKKFV